MTALLIVIVVQLSLLGYEVSMMRSEAKEKVSTGELDEITDLLREIRDESRMTPAERWALRDDQ